LLVPPVVGFDVAAPGSLLSNALDDHGNRLYDVKFCTARGEPALTTLGAELVPHGDARLLATADTVIIPGTHNPDVRRLGSLDEPTRHAMTQIRADARLISICTGVFVLAAAGLLAEAAATTHWSALDDLQRLHPSVIAKRALYTEHGRISTSAGLGAAIDLCLHIIRQDHGAQTANRVARFAAVQGWRSGDQPQFAETPLPEEGVQSTAIARDWAVTHLGEPITVAVLAAISRQSVRTFSRRFREETGSTPHVWLSQQRVRLAQRILETTDLSVDEVAHRSGFSSPTSMRVRFRAIVGTSPGAYRQAFSKSDSPHGRNPSPHDGVRSMG
jgi:transcriptional regulator GlxA family with amidase domain